MRNFENELCTTVDTILEILGQKPKVTRELFEQSCSVPRWDRATRPKGPRLVKTPSELDRVLENMWLVVCFVTSAIKLSLDWRVLESTGLCASHGVNIYQWDYIVYSLPIVDLPFPLMWTGLTYHVTKPTNRPWYYGKRCENDERQKSSSDMWLLPVTRDFNRWHVTAMIVDCSAFLCVFKSHDCLYECYINIVPLSYPRRHSNVVISTQIYKRCHSNVDCHIGGNDISIWRRLYLYE